MKKIIFVFFTMIGSLFFIYDNVYAESLGEKFTNFVVSGFEFLVGDGFTGVKDFADYDSRLSLFDGLENNIPKCYKDYYAYDNGSIFQSSYDGAENICYEGTVPNLNVLIEHLPYLIRYEYRIKNTNISYYVFEFHSTIPTISNDLIEQNSYYDGIVRDVFTISMLPSFFTTADGEIIPFAGKYSNNIYNANTNSSYIEFELSYNQAVGMSHDFYYTNHLSEYYDLIISSNFDLKEYESNKTLVNATTEYIFDTDIDITVPSNYYLDLMPKGINDFSSHIYTNNFFYFDYSIYDNYNKVYSPINSGALSQINISALGGFNWLYWNVEFSSSQIQLNPIISIFNPNDTDLIIKIKSSDFNYKVINKESGDYCIGDICYSNRYEDLFNGAHSFNYRSDFSNDDYDNGLSFVKNIPNMITDFVSSFAFIGTLLTTIFSIFTGSLLNYFYIIFGIMIIMIIIRTLK